MASEQETKKKKTVSEETKQKLRDAAARRKAEVEQNSKAEAKDDARSHRTCPHTDCVSRDEFKAFMYSVHTIVMRLNNLCSRDSQFDRNRMVQQFERELAARRKGS